MKKTFTSFITLLWVLCICALSVSAKNQAKIKKAGLRYSQEQVNIPMLNSFLVSGQLTYGDVFYANKSDNAYQVDSMFTYTIPEGGDGEFPESREVYTYNSNGQNTSVILHNNIGYYDFKIDWMPSMKMLQQFNQKGNVKKVQSFNWVDTINAYRKIIEQSRYYLSNQVDVDSLVHSVDFNGDGIEPWIVNSIKYGTNGRPMQSLDYKLNDDSVWIVDNVTDIYFDNKGNDTAHITTTFDQKSKLWINYSKNSKTYDSTGNMLSTIFLNWKEDQEKWIMEDKTEYKYDGSGRILERTEYGGDYNTGEEKPESKVSSRYNNEGNLDSTVVYKYDSQDSIWENDNKTIIEYDNNGNKVSSISYRWYYSEGKWEKERKRIFNYNTSIVCDVLYSAEYSSNSIPVVFKNLLTDTKTYKWDSDSEDFKLLNHEQFHTSKFQATHVSEPEQASIRIYPNPASSVLNIQSSVQMDKGIRHQPSVLELYDLNGRKLLKKHIPSGLKTFELNVRDLQSGVYLCKFSFANQSITKKIVIQ